MTISRRGTRRFVLAIVYFTLYIIDRSRWYLWILTHMHTYIDMRLKTRISEKKTDEGRAVDIYLLFH